MKIVIKRISKTGDAIDGHLYIDGMKICDCAENAKSCLKAGTYPVVRHKCKQYARYMPVILDNNASVHPDIKPTPTLKCDTCPKCDLVFNNTAMPCRCPMIKMGNGVHNREDGSIIIGSNICPGCLKLSKAPFEMICERMRKLDGRGCEITVTIINNFQVPPFDLLTPYEIGTRIIKQMGGRKVCCENL